MATSKTKQPKKVYEGTSVRISDSIYHTVSKFAESKGMKIGKYFEIAAMEKYNREVTIPKK